MAGRRPSASAAASDEPGDEEWWALWGFKGTLSDQKKKDYGNGVPTWSPYHKSTAAAAEPVPKAPVGLPADAFWFKQFGFKCQKLSEDKRRDYGDGIPMWSPYRAPRPAAKPSSTTTP